MPFDKSILSINAESKLKNEVESNEINITAYIEEIGKFLKEGETKLEKTDKYIAEALKKDRPDIEIKVLQKLQNLVENAIEDVKEAEKGTKELKTDKPYVLLDFVQNGYQKLIKLRNEVWLLEQTVGIGQLFFLNRMRQMTHSGVSKARLIILILEDKVEVKNERFKTLIEVSNNCYLGIGFAVSGFELLLDHEDQFFYQNLTKVEFVVFKALYKLYAEALKDATEMKLQFEDAQYDKDQMIPILKINLEKVLLFEREVRELLKTEGLSERDVKMFEHVINDQLIPIEKGLTNQIAILESL